MAYVSYMTTTDIILSSPKELSDFILDELARWAALECPTIWEPRPFKMDLFHWLEKANDKHNGSRDPRSRDKDPPILFNFTKNGYIVIKVKKKNSTSRWFFARFNIANPDLSKELEECFTHLDGEDLSDFIDADMARDQWMRSS